MAQLVEHGPKNCKQRGQDCHECSSHQKSSPSRRHASDARGRRRGAGTHHRDWPLDGSPDPPVHAHGHHCNKTKSPVGAGPKAGESESQSGQQDAEPTARKPGPRQDPPRGQLQTGGRPTSARHKSRRKEATEARPDQPQETDRRRDWPCKRSGPRGGPGAPTKATASHREASTKQTAPGERQTRQDKGRRPRKGQEGNAPRRAGRHRGQSVPQPLRRKR